MITKEKALEYISEIRTVQDLRRGTETRELPEWFIIIRRQLQKAEDEWYRGKQSNALYRIGHVGACACAALEHNGEDTRPPDDSLN